MFRAWLFGWLGRWLPDGKTARRQTMPDLWLGEQGSLSELLQEIAEGYKQA
jgi:hypothetical protein